MADRTVRVVLQGDATALVNAARQAQAALRDLSNTNVGRIGAGMREAGAGAREAQSAFDKFKASVLGQVSLGNLAAMGVASAFRGIKDAIGDTIKAGADYQTTLNIMGAVSGATADQMTQVSAKARELGKDIQIPGTSATDAARAMTELAKGGLSVADAMTAAKGTLQLAAAAQVDAAKAAEIQVNAMAAFHIKASEAAHVADVLANVSNAASGEMTDFAAGLTAAGATADSFGISLEDTNTVLGLFANAGIKGEEGGTLFKTMLTKLAAPSKPAAAAIKELGLTVYDASGNFVGMSSITDQLRAAHERMTTAAYNTNTAIVFGTRGIKGAAILGSEAADAFGKMSDSINQTGTAEQVAAAKMEGFNGSLENLKNQWQDIQLSIFDKVGPGLTDLITNVAGALPQVADAAMGAIGYVGSRVGQFLGPLIDGAKGLAEKVAPYVLDFASSIKDGVTTALDAIAPFGEKLGELFSKAQGSGVLDLVGTALVGVGKAFEGVANAVGPIVDVVGKVVDFFANMPGPVQTAVLALGAMILLRGPIFAFFDGVLLKATQAAFSVATAAVSIRTSGGIMSASMATVKAAATGMWAAIGGWIGIGITAVVTALSLFSGKSDAAAQSTEGLTQAIDDQTGKLKGNAAQIIATEAANSGASAAYQRLGGNVADYVDALGGVPGAQEKVNAKIAEGKAAYDAQQAAMAAATQGTAGFAGAQSAAATAAGNAAPAIQDLNTASGYLASAHGTLAQKTNDVKLATEGATGALGGTSGAADDLAASQDVLNAAMAAGADPTAAMKDALKDLKTAADEADTAGQFLWATLEQIHGNNIGAAQAARLEAAAFREIGASARDLADANAKVTEKQQALNDAVNQYGSDSPQAAQASRDLAAANDAVSAASDKQYDSLQKAAQAGLDAAGAAYANKAAQGDLAGATDAARDATQAARDEFIKTQPEVDQLSGKAADLADQYHLIPDEVVTNLQANGVQSAIQQVSDLNKQLDQINNKTVRYYVVNGSPVQLDAPSTTGGGASSTDYLRALAGHADGGWVSGPGGPREDKVAARLSPGEFVVNAAQAGRNSALLEAINSGAMGFADGGSVPGGDTAATAGAAVAVTAPDPAVFEAAWKAISETAKTAWEQVILPVMQAMSAQNVQAGVDFTTLAATIQQQQGVIQPTYDVLNAGTQGVGIWQQWLAQVWAQSWQSNQDLTAAGVASIGASWSALSAATDAAWSSIGARIQGTYDGQIVPAWNGVQSFASQVGSFFSSLAAGVDGATSQVTGDVADIKGALVDFFTVVDARLPAHANGGLVDGGAHADGGLITVGTGPRTDDVLIRVSRGEYVVNAAATARNRDALDAINNGTSAFANGGLVGDQVKDQMVTGSQESVGDAVSKVLAALAVNVGGFNPSQDPSSFGWGRAQGIVPFSWQGHPILGGVAGGTERLWSSLLDFLVPQIPGGLTEPMYGYENRDNVNSPGRASFHAYGLATDINAGANPNGVPVDARSGPGVIPSGAARQIAARLGFLWGGDFGGTPDSMHFELHLPPALIGGVGADTSFATGAGWKQSIMDAIGKAKENALAPVPTASGDAARYSPTGGVEQWRALGLQVLTNVGNYLGRDLTGYIGNMLLQISTESSGNPQAINLTDSNALRGTPSKGLMQVIDPTAATALRGTPFEGLLARGMFDPEANMTASTLYGLVTGPYHDLAQAWRGVAYAGGGLVLGPGGPFDDQIPARLSNGEFVVNARSAAANMSALHAINSGRFDHAWGQMHDSTPAQFDSAGFAQALEDSMTKVLGSMSRGGVNIENLNAYDPQMAMAEVEYALARVR